MAVVLDTLIDEDPRDNIKFACFDLVDKSVLVKIQSRRDTCFNQQL